MTAINYFAIAASVLASKILAIPVPLATRDPGHNTTNPTHVVSQVFIPAAGLLCEHWHIIANNESATFRPECGQWVSDPSADEQTPHEYQLNTVQLDSPDIVCTQWHVGSHDRISTPICGNYVTEVWQEHLEDNPPTKRDDHTAVIDTDLVDNNHTVMPGDEQLQTERAASPSSMLSNLDGLITRARRIFLVPTKRPLDLANADATDGSASTGKLETRSTFWERKKKKENKKKYHFGPSKWWTKHQPPAPQWKIDRAAVTLLLDNVQYDADPAALISAEDRAVFEAPRKSSECWPSVAAIHVDHPCPVTTLEKASHIVDGLIYQPLLGPLKSRDRKLLLEPWLAGW